MSDIIPFDSVQLPAHLRNSRFSATNDLVMGEGFPVISIKGKVFTKVHGDTRELITAPDSDDEPARSLEVVVLNYNKHLSKVYYDTSYSEGSDNKPTCYSNNGVGPAADATNPQSKTCATCPHNQWGSRITDNGAKAKACSDSRRLAIAPAGQLNDPMLLRVPPTSLRALAQYQDLLYKRGVAIQQVVTKVGFDYNVAHPSLTFKPVGFLTEAQLDEVESVFETPVVMSIIGLAEATPAVESPAPRSPAPSAAAPAKKSEPEPEPEPEAPKRKRRARVQVEDEESAPAPAKAEAKTEAKSSKAAIEVDDDLSSALDALLGDEDFDD